VTSAVVASRRRLLPTTLAALALLIVLLGLGSWQVQRLAWKEGILATIAKSEAGPAQPLGDDAQPYTKVQVEGHFLPDRVALYGSEVRDAFGAPVIGAHQIVPLERPDGLPVLVDRGWLPANAEQTVRVPDGAVSVEGYVRPPEPRSWFSAADDPARHRFFSLDPATIAAALGVGPVLKLTLVALASGPDAGAANTTYPQPATHLPRPPNDHFAYAVTWFSLAVVLVVMFAIWFRGALTT
jgi:surfeit locus 1 family protein